MVHELELRILEVDPAELDVKLVGIGAEKVFDGDLISLYFKRVGQEIERGKEEIRLRKIGEKVLLTYKKQRVDCEFGSKDEYEVEVSDLETTRLILESIGFEVWLELRKRRISYRLDGVCFEIDIYSGDYEAIPPFMEIEAGNVEEIYEAALNLGFSKEECTTKGFDDFVEMYVKGRSEE